VVIALSIRVSSAGIWPSSISMAGLIRKSRAEADAFAAKRARPGFRRVMMRMTLVWGFGLVSSALLSCVLVYALTIRQYLVAGPIVGYATMGGLALWTLIYRRRAERAGAAAELGDRV
jgi:hypothetical protein